MTSEEVLLKKFKVLPINRQQELLDFAEFFESKETKREKIKEFRVRSKRLGFRNDLNYDKTSELLEEIESAAQ